MRPRKHTSELPSRLYEAYGKKIYSIAYRRPDGIWDFRLRCNVNDTGEIAAIRQEAINLATGKEKNAIQRKAFKSVAQSWYEWQMGLPKTSAERRADSTLAENAREIARLNITFGRKNVTKLIKADAYAYLRNPQNSAERPAKANKEIALARLILEYAVTLGMLRNNPFDRVRKLLIIQNARLVTDQEMELALKAGRALGGSYQTVALALKTAWLCVRRSTEIRSLQVQQINEQGIAWQSGKRRLRDMPMAGLIHWSPELKATMDEALSLRGPDPAPDCFVFGNLEGKQYTKGGWKKMLDTVMKKAKELAEQDNVPFERFSLQDCRPKGVTDKMAAGHDDVIDAALHTSDRMIRQVYDRRRVREATPAR